MSSIDLITNGLVKKNNRTEKMYVCVLDVSFRSSQGKESKTFIKSNCGGS